MRPPYTRRHILKHAGLAGAAFLQPAKAQSGSLHVAGSPVEVQIAPVTAVTFRLTIFRLQDGKTTPVAEDGALVQESWGAPAAKLREARAQTVKVGSLQVKTGASPLSFAIETAKGEAVQRLEIDGTTGAVSFAAGNAPLLGLGQGGPQLDRRGSNIGARSGQGAYQLRTHGGRVPIPWLIGTGGWAMFVHHPAGSFDLTGATAKFAAPSAEAALPLDIFFVASREPATLMAEYARITGLPEMPPLWSFGYQQSHRTLGSREEILAEADEFRKRKLPCDTMIYLGTGFCPSGWNTDNTEFTFNSKVFPDPKAIFDAFHEKHFKVVLHVAYPVRIPEMRGTVKDKCDPQQRAETQPSCYWEMHKPVWKLGVDGWWPDEGDALNGPSRLVRNRMYWEAPQLDRPNERPYALHRNGYPGMQRYAPFLWSGDVYSQWETLKTHVPVAVNTGLSGIPYWGTDIGGFIPTADLTGELYARWFQFAAFCPLFRSHGRTWKLRLPWGWNTGDPGPVETNFKPDPNELHNAQVEPVCKKYLELRYQLMPYLYSLVRESTTTGMPIMRSMWLHYADDPTAVARGDQYLWGRDMLVAPVVEKGATSRQVYLPKGAWYDFWTGERTEGGREVTRKVDLMTTPLYVRAGGIVPMGPIKQYTSEKVDEPLALTVYPGADGSFLLYEDDGSTFDYRKGEWMGVQLAWNDARRVLSLRLARGSKMLAPARRTMTVKLGSATRTIVFEGRPLEVKL